MSATAESLELAVHLTGASASAAEYTATARTFQEATAKTTDSFEKLSTKTREVDVKIQGINKAFANATPETAGFSSRIKGLRAELEAAGHSTAEVNAKMARLEAQLRATGLPAKELDSHFKTLEKSGIGFATVFKGALAAGLVQQGIQRAGSEMKEFIASSIGATLQLQRLDRTFKFATGSAAAGKEEFAFVRAEVNRLGLDLGVGAEQYSKLTAAANGTVLAGQKTRDIFIGVSEAGAALGLSSEAQAGALNAVQQMMSKGTVQAEELRGQLGERIPGAFQIASRAMGVSTQALGKMLEQGQVLSTEFLPKFGAQLHKEMALAAQEAAGGAQGSFNRFNNAMLESKAILGEELMPVLAEFAEFIAQDVVPFWVPIFKQLGSESRNQVRRDTEELMKEMERLKEVGNTPFLKLETTARVNIESRRNVDKLERDPDANKPAKGSNDANQELSSERVNAILGLEKEYSTAKIQAQKQGFDQERALETAEHNRRLQLYKGKTKELELVEDVHLEKMVSIADREAEEKTKIMQESEEKGVDFQKVKMDRKDKEIRADEEATQQIYESQAYMRNLDIELEEDAYQRKLKQNKAHFAEMREALAEHASKDATVRAQYQTKITAIDKKELAARKKIELENGADKVAYALAIGSDLLKGMDGFYAKSKKNADLHKAINIGIIQMDAAVASIRAIKELGVPAGVVAAVLIELKAAAASVQVANQKFTGGGIVQGASTSGDRISVGVNAGEMILNPAQQANLFAMANGQGGGQSITNHFELNYSGGDISLPAGATQAHAIADYMRQQPGEFARAFKDLALRGYFKGVRIS